MTGRYFPLLFRFDAGPDVGLGHWYRCVALAEELRRTSPQDITFLVKSLDAPLRAELRQRGIPFYEAHDWTRIERIDAMLAEQPGARIVLDTMDTERAYVEALCERTSVLSIGGSGEGRDFVTVRIDGMLPRPGYAEGFRGKRLYLGPEYVILRPFFAAPPLDGIRDRISRVLIALGGDAAAVGCVVAHTITSLMPEIEVDVMVGALTPLPGEKHPAVRVHRGIENPRPLMEACDLAIVSGGMTAYELMRMGRPMLLLPQTDLQEEASRAFEQAGVGLLIPRAEQRTVDHLRTALESRCARLAAPDSRAHCARAGRDLVDGKGLQRVADAIRQWSREKSE